MQTRELSLPEIGLIAGTRMMLGAGVGLLAAPFLTREQRKTIGWTLVAMGIASTVPLALHVVGQVHLEDLHLIRRARARWHN